MKTKEQFLLETHGDKDLTIDLVKKAMDLYALQKSCKEGELAQAFKAGEIYACDRQNGLNPVDFEGWYKGLTAPSNNSSSEMVGGVEKGYKTCYSINIRHPHKKRINNVLKL